MGDCKLVFNNYEIEKISLERSDAIPNPQEGTGFLFKIVPNKKAGFDKVNIIEGVLINPSEDFKYKLEIIVRGNFIISDCEDDEEKHKLLLTNASAIIFPYLRALVSTVSSQIDYGNIILPVMNFHEVFREQELKDILLNYKQFKSFN